MENEVKYLYLDDIIPNRFQPRENFDEQALKELAVSIKEHGVIQPIVVRQIGEKYEIIAGERRYKASTMAGLTQIPAIVKNLDDKESSKVALIENLQRKDLTAIEEARTYQKILELDALTQEDLARTMGKSQSAVSNKLRLLSLTDEVQDALLHEQISERHARSLLNISDPAKQVELLNKVINSRMTVRELDQEIKNMQEGNGSQNIIQSSTNIGDSSIPSANINPTSVDVNSIRNNTSDILTQQQPVNIDNLLKPEGMMPNNDVLFNGAQTNEPQPMDILSSQLPHNNPDGEVIGGSGLLAGHNAEEIIKPSNNTPIQIEPQTPNNLFPSNESSTPVIEPVENNSIGGPIPPVGEEPININHVVESMGIDNSSQIGHTPQETINKIKTSVTELKNQGNKIDIEEFDFDDFYQFVIRVNKQ